MPFWYWPAVAFIFGSVVGSFLNVCIWRMPNDESIVSPPSHCPKCNTKLRGPDLVPLFSFLLLGRKCRYCGVPIGWRYFGVELLTGLTFLALYFRLHTDPVIFVFDALFCAALIAVFFIDLDHWIIPDQLSVFGILLGIGRDVYGLVTGHGGRPLLHIPIPFTSIQVPMLQSIAWLVVCGGIFYAIAYFGQLAFKKEAMGGGDIKLAAAIGANYSLGLSLLSFFIAVFVGTFVGLGLKIRHRNSEEEDDGLIPFGPFMVAGVFAIIFYGNEMLAAYMNYLGRGGFHP